MYRYGYFCSDICYVKSYQYWSYVYLILHIYSIHMHLELSLERSHKCKHVVINSMHNGSMPQWFSVNLSVCVRYGFLTTTKLLRNVINTMILLMEKYWHSLLLKMLSILIIIKNSWSNYQYTSICTFLCFIVWNARLLFVVPNALVGSFTLLFQKCIYTQWFWSSLWLWVSHFLLYLLHTYVTWCAL